MTSSMGLDIRRQILPLLFGCVAFAVSGCQPADSLSQSDSEGAPESDPADVFQTDAGLRILFCGNSHTRSHNIAATVSALCEASRAGLSTPETHVLSGSFLDDIAGDPLYEAILQQEHPEIVVLQGQMVSMSGKYIYSRDAADQMARSAIASGARVLLYAEWGRQGIEGETERIEAIYQQISEAAGGTVVPVGRAWQLAIQRHPDFVLFADDGNHASPLGAFLTSCVLAATVTGQNPETAAGQIESPVPVADRLLLAKVAWETVGEAVSRKDTDE